MTPSAVDSAPALPDDLLAYFCPVLYLHHSDAYMPCSVEWFLERAELNFYHDGVTGAAELHELDLVPGGISRLISAGQVTQAKLLEAQAGLSHAAAGNLSLTVAPEHYAGHRRDRLSEVPVYVHTKLVVDESTGAPEAYELNYITFYSFNGHYHLPFGMPLFSVGHHVGDWEHLTVRLDATTLELQGVWYNAHRNMEGEWCPAAGVPRTPCGRIIGHVAINGHGVYPHCGIIPRLFFVANDRTSRAGPVWNPSRLVRLCGTEHGAACPIVVSRGCSLPPLFRRGPALRPQPTFPASSSSLHQPLTELGAGHHVHRGGATAAVTAGVAATADDIILDMEALAMNDSGAALLQPSPRGGAAGSAAAAGGAAARSGCGAATGRASSSSSSSSAFTLPALVHDASPWQRYRGCWGSVISATQQGWFVGPEPPVSRGLIKRLFLPCAPGVDRWPRQIPLPVSHRPAAAAGAQVLINAERQAGC